MIIRNFYEAKLAQASYLVGCGATGEAVVIDALRDIGQYIEMAASLGLTITAVTETHIHADYLSGSRELARTTGAKLYLSDEGDATWKYGFAGEEEAVLLKDGDVIRIGNLTLKVVHTPGHTPEHIAFLLTDHPAGDTPHSMFTGDFVFAGDVGRPDLLERAANFEGTMEAGARTLHRSLQKLAGLPDSLLLWPAHGAGSACGKSLGGSPVTSLGYERSTNWAFQIRDEDKFVNEVLSGQPEPPSYFKEMKRLNKIGPPVLGSLPNVPHADRVVGILVDVRPATEVRSGAIDGALAIPEGKAFTNWAGWLLAYDEPVTLVASDQAQADLAARDLAMIGLDVVLGWVRAEDAPGNGHRTLPMVTATDLPEGAFVLDVRGANERKLSSVKGSAHIPLGYLASHLSQLPTHETVYVHCQSGLRSLMAVTLLARAGLTNVVEIAGGIEQIAKLRPQSVA